MKIYEAIPKIMARIGAIGKDKRNTQQNFNYRGVDDVMNALQPLLHEYGVFIVPEIIEQRREERQSKNGANLIYSVCTIRYTFFADDGSSISATVIGEGMDSGDKATNKAMAIAFKYACFQVFCIPTEEMKDPDAETPPPSEPKKGTTIPPTKSNPPMPKVAPPKDDLVTPSQAKELVQMSRDKWGDLAAKMFRKLTGFESTKAVPAAAFEECKQAIEAERVI